MTKTERLSHYGVIMIAITAVVVSIWQVQISERQLDIAMAHNKLTVRPYLEITKNVDGTDEMLALDLSNQGYGPAIIRRFELTYDEQVYNAWNPVLDAANLNPAIRQLYNYSEGSVLAPGANRVIMKLATPNSQKGISLLIVYESIYQQLDSTRINF